MKTLLLAGVLVTGCTDEALESGDCPGTPKQVTLVPVAPFTNGLVIVEFQSHAPPGNIEMQRYSAARSLWEPTYGSLSEKEDGTFVARVSTQTSDSEAGDPLKVRIRSDLQGCPPSDWAETDPVDLEDPISNTTWVAELGPGTLSTQINVSYSGAGTSIGPYRLSPTMPLRHSINFAAGGTLNESFDVTIESSTASDLYAGCRLKLVYAGKWVATKSSDGRIAIYDRRIVSSVGSTCANPPVAQLSLASIPPIQDDVLSTGNIDYSPLLESPAGAAELQSYSLPQAIFGSAITGFSDQVGPETSYVNGYINAFDPRYRKQ